MKIISFLIQSLLLCKLNLILSQTHVKMESMKHRHTFKKRSSIVKSTLHEVVFAVKQNNLNVLDAMLMRRGNPTDSLYQHWLTYKEITSITINKEGSDTITQFLTSQNISIVHTSKRAHYIRATAPLSTWERIFNTEFFSWEDLTNKKRRNR